jgi:hypothetical protein
MPRAGTTIDSTFALGSFGDPPPCSREYRIDDILPSIRSRRLVVVEDLVLQ